MCRKKVIMSHNVMVFMSQVQKNGQNQSNMTHIYLQRLLWVIYKLELCHWRDVYPHMLHWHRIFCMLSHKTREAYLWQFLRIIMPLSFMAILTFEILNSLAWYAIQCLWTKLMWRVILKSHNEWHSYGPDKLIYGHFWPLNSKCDLDLGDIDVILSTFEILT